MLDCASPGPPSSPNSLLLRERSARALSLVCLCAGPTPASPVVLAGLVLLLQCRDGGVVGEAAAAALWALCHAPENRKALSSMRYDIERVWREHASFGWRGRAFFLFRPKRALCGGCSVGVEPRAPKNRKNSYPRRGI